MAATHPSRSHRWRTRLGLLALAAPVLTGAHAAMPIVSDTPQRPAATIMTLPAPATAGALSLEETLTRRRSVRSFTAAPRTLGQVSQILWAAQGGTYRGERRTAPSAGALYPLELYLVAGAVDGLAAGVYHYRQRDHALEQTVTGDLRRSLAVAAVDQSWIARAPAVLVITAVHRRTAGKYGPRAERYVAIEVGCAGENVYLQATSLGLGTTMVGAFQDDRVHQLLDLPADHRPMVLMPLGIPR